MRRLPLALGTFFTLSAFSFAAFRYFQSHHYESVPQALSSPKPTSTLELLPSDPSIRVNTEIFGPPLASYPAREDGGDAYPAFMDVRDEKRFDLLLKILEKKRDNDPRLDREFKSLSPALKSAIKEEFFLRQPEERNAKGTLVFLIGRELNSEDDISFLQAVLNEEPCLSLKKCNTPSDGVDSHESGATEVTLAYPQRVALLSLERALRKQPHGPLASAMRELLARTRDASPIPSIQRAARDALSRLQK